MQHKEAINILHYHGQHPMLLIHGTLFPTDSDYGIVLTLKLIPASSINGRPSHFKKETTTDLGIQKVNACPTMAFTSVDINRWKTHFFLNDSIFH